jgi:hypothetical protein
MGECNGLYITDITTNGFTVKELNNGSSNVQISWIAVGDRIDAKTTEVPSFLKAKTFDRNMNGVLFNDANTTQSGQGIWWDGTTFQFNQNYPSSLNPSREEKERRMMKDSKK